MEKIEKQPVVCMRGINKYFGPILANADVDFEVIEGEIHALVGENGAGKSTLMNVLYGLLRPNAGEIFVRGRPIRNNSPQVATEVGIGMVHQHFMLIPRLTVAENVVLGREPRRGRRFDRGAAIRRVEELSRQFGLDVDPRSDVGDLPVGLRQRVEILKLLHRGADVLILDEPTAVLSPQEVGELFGILRTLREDGKTIILITHKLSEVMTISDRVTVMRSGRVEGVMETKETTLAQLAWMMVGRQVVGEVGRGDVEVGLPLLSVRGLEAHGLHRLRGVDFDVRSGEIVGVAGVEGNGQTELVEVLTGLRFASGGEVVIKGEVLDGWDPRRVRDVGVAHIPEDRQAMGLLLDFTVSENAILGVHHRRQFSNWLLRRGEIERHSRRLVADYDVRPAALHVTARTLSGGNQQKLVVAREVDQCPDLLIASQPTRGVDIGSIEFIHRQLLKLRSKGKGILLISADLEEILALSDRILVIYDGRMVGEFASRGIDEGELGRMMVGGG